MKKIVILQSNYIPWKGYFDLLAAADEFIIYDEAQFTKNDWRNRNLIKTNQGLCWLTIPVQTKGSGWQAIKDVTVSDTAWSKKHWKSLTQYYCKTANFEKLAEVIEPLYAMNWKYLSEINYAFISAIANYLHIETKISFSWDYKASVTGKTARLVDLCLQAGATEYISGPSAKNYLEEQLFTENKIAVSWFDYDNYLKYPQIGGEFVHEVSILDLLFHCGQNSANYMKHVNRLL